MADHFRRGPESVTETLYVGGYVFSLLTMVGIVLVLARHQAGAALAVVTGFAQALGFSMVHLLPEWSPLSDSYVDPEHHHVTWYSWTAALLAIVVGALFGLAGIRSLRRERGAEGTS